MAVGDEKEGGMKRPTAKKGEYSRVGDNEIDGKDKRGQ